MNVNETNNKNEAGNDMSLVLIAGNPLLYAMPYMKLSDMQVFLMAISKIKWKHLEDGNLSKYLEPKELLTFDYEEFRKVFGLKHLRKIREYVTTAAERLRRIPVTINAKDWNEYVALNGLDFAKKKSVTFSLVRLYVTGQVGSHSEGNKISISFESMLYPFISQLKAAFTILDIEEISKLSFTPAIKLYMVIKSRLNGNSHVEMRVTPDELRLLLLGANHKKWYTNNNAFTRFVKKIVEDINEKCQCHFEVTSFRKLELSHYLIDAYATKKTKRITRCSTGYKRKKELTRIEQSTD